MQLRASDLWRWNGALDRGPYAVWGCLLFALKYNLDRIAALAYGRAWSPLGYLRIETPGPLASLPMVDLRFYGTLVALALPFIYVGIAMTLKRLRSAGLPLGLAALFFVPLVNLLFFLVLSVLPAAPLDAPLDRARRRQRFIDALIPESQLGAAALGLLVTTVVGVLMTLLAVHGMREYGFGLFMGLPFMMGVVSVLFYSYHAHRRLRSCLAVACLSVILLGGALLAVAVEGFICILMAAPIGLCLALMGGCLGYFIQRGGTHRVAPQALSLLLVFLPVIMGAESLESAPPPLIAVTTSVDVDAPPERVWPNVIAFSELPPPKEWVFHTGIAYPIRARIMGHGVGAVRRCEFTTGPFVEPITVWDPPRHLAFNVAAQPRSMDEMSPWGQIHAPHIDHFLLSEHGEFRLEPLPGGRTRLYGTTWYRHKIWPVTYWRPWSDAILHAIHTRVLVHVKAVTEGQRSNGE